MRLKIGADGNVTAVYSDRLREVQLGPIAVTRASNVEFNPGTQEWEAHTPEGELIAKGVNRDQCIRDEVRVIETRL